MTDCCYVFFNSRQKLNLTSWSLWESEWVGDWLSSNVQCGYWTSRKVRCVSICDLFAWFIVIIIIIFYIFIQFIFWLYFNVQFNFSLGPHSCETAGNWSHVNHLEMWSVYLICLSNLKANIMKAPFVICITVFDAWQTKAILTLKGPRTHPSQWEDTNWSFSALHHVERQRQVLRRNNLYAWRLS